MSAAHTNLVEFVGGPFDGFRQHVWDSIDDLPERVAIPVDQRSARVLGLDRVHPQSTRSAIYYLQLSTGVARYCFRKPCPMSEIQSTISSETR